MLPVKTILCPLDFSEYSYKALKDAEELAEKFSATLLLVHVVPQVPVSTTMQTEPIGYNAPSGIGNFKVTEYMKQLKSNAEETLKDTAENKLNTGTGYETVVLQGGNEADEINKLADERNVDLIVLSTHGRTGIKRLFFGSVAEKIIRHAEKPVLTMRYTV